LVYICWQHGLSFGFSTLENHNYSAQHLKGDFRPVEFETNIIRNIQNLGSFFQILSGLLAAAHS
jgi:hypothetical protein